MTKSPASKASFASSRSRASSASAGGRRAHRPRKASRTLPLAAQHLGEAVVGVGAVGARRDPLASVRLGLLAVARVVQDDAALERASPRHGADASALLRRVPRIGRSPEVSVAERAPVPRSSEARVHRRDLVAELPDRLEVAELLVDRRRPVADLDVPRVALDEGEESPLGLVGVVGLAGDHRLRGVEQGAVSLGEIRSQQRGPLERGARVVARVEPALEQREPEVGGGERRLYLHRVSKGVHRLAVHAVVERLLPRAEGGEGLRARGRGGRQRGEGGDGRRRARRRGRRRRLRSPRPEPPRRSHRDDADRERREENQPEARARAAYGGRNVRRRRGRLALRQRFEQRPAVRVTRRRVLLEAAKDHRLERRRHPRLEAGRRHGRVAFDGDEDLERTLPRERPTSGGELVEHDAAREDVGARVEGATLGLLGRHVAGRAEDLALGGEGGLHLGDVGRGGRRGGETEVEHLHHPLLGQHDVVRLEIAVHHALRVGARERRGDPPRHALHLLRRQALRHVRPQGGPAQVLHGDVDAALVLPHLVDGRDVRVAHGGGGAGLAEEARALGGLPDRGQHLERDDTTQLLVVGGVDHAHPALAELRADAEVGDAVSGADGLRVGRGEGLGAGRLAQEVVLGVGGAPRVHILLLVLPCHRPS